MSTSSYARFMFVSWLLCTCTLLFACGSTSSQTSAGRPEKTGRPLRVRYVAYASGKMFELVNDSHTDRNQLYSSTKALDDASTKVATDEVMDATVALFRENGYFEHAVSGSAPLTAKGNFSGALEVEESGNTTFWALPRGASAEDHKRFSTCSTNFLALYTNTYGLQSVSRAPDWQNQGVTAKKKKAQ